MGKMHPVVTHYGKPLSHFGVMSPHPVADPEGQFNGGGTYSIQESGASLASGASSGVGSRDRGPGGSAPGSPWVLALIRCPGMLYWK